MHKTATVNARIEPQLKKKAEKILDTVGISTPEAIRLFYKQICLRKGLPFSVNIPNKQTLKAMQDAEEGKTYSIDNLEDLL